MIPLQVNHVPRLKSMRRFQWYRIWYWILYRRSTVVKLLLLRVSSIDSRVHLLLRSVNHAVR